MDNIKNDSYYIKKIKTDLNFLIGHTADLTLKELQSNEVLCDCIMFRLVQISENSAKLTEDFKSLNKNIPWAAIKGLRNRIVHDYGEVDLTIVYDAVKYDVPLLLRQLESF